MANIKSGRPSVVNDTVVGKLEDAIKHGASITEACFVSGISRDTFYEHCRSDKEFSDKMEQARCWLAMAAKRNLAKSIESGDIKSSVWLLERQNTVPFSSIESEVPSVESETQRLGWLQNYIDKRIQIYRQDLEREYDFVPK